MQVANVTYTNHKFGGKLCFTSQFQRPCNLWLSLHRSLSLAHSHSNKAVRDVMAVHPTRYTSADWCVRLLRTTRREVEQSHQKYSLMLSLIMQRHPQPLFLTKLCTLVCQTVVHVQECSVSVYNGFRGTPGIKSTTVRVWNKKESFLINCNDIVYIILHVSIQCKSHTNKLL